MGNRITADDVASIYEAARKAKEPDDEQAHERRVSRLLIEAHACGDPAYPSKPMRYLVPIREREVSLEATFAEAGGELQSGTDLVDALRIETLARIIVTAPLSDRQSNVIAMRREGATWQACADAWGVERQTIWRDMRSAYTIIRNHLPKDPYWNLLEVLLEVFFAKTLKMAGRL